PLTHLAGRVWLRGERFAHVASNHRPPWQEPGMDQRNTGHGGAVASGWRSSVGHPWPTCMAEPDKARIRAELTGCLCGLEQQRDFDPMGPMACGSERAPTGTSGASKPATGAGAAAMADR